MVRPTRHVGAGLWGLLGPTAHGLPGRRHLGPRLSHLVGWGWGLKYRDSQIFVRGAWHVLSYLGVWSLRLVSPTFFSASSKKKNYLTGRLAWSRRNTVGVGPTPYKWFLPELDLHLSRERAALAPFSRISRVGHSGSWPPLHCRDSTKPAPEVVPGASLHSEALSPECGREHQETGDS